MSAVLLAVLLPAASQVTYSTKPYLHKGVQLNASEVYHKKDKVWFRLQVVNKTGKPLTIDKNQVNAKVNNAVLPREKGVWGKYAKPHTIGAGLSGEFNIEFTIGEVPQPVALVLENGFIVEGKSIDLPDYPAQPAG